MEEVKKIEFHWAQTLLQVLPLKGLYVSLVSITKFPKLSNIEHFLNIEILQTS